MNFHYFLTSLPGDDVFDSYFYNNVVSFWKFRPQTPYNRIAWGPSSPRPPGTATPVVNF